MAKPKKVIADIEGKKPDVNLILTKRHLDLYRDDNGHLKNIKIENIEIDNYTFKSLSLEGADFENVRFKKCLFQGSDLTKTKIKDCSFEECDLRWVSITKEQSESNMFMNCQERELHVV